MSSASSAFSSLPNRAAAYPAAAVGPSTLLPTITASLRGEFIPLLQALESVGSFAGATYIIEVVFALVRFDAFLKREERESFVRAFSSLITSMLKEREKLEAMRRQLEESREYLVGLVARCGILEGMAEAQAQEELMRCRPSFTVNPSRHTALPISCPNALRGGLSGDFGDGTAEHGHADPNATTSGGVAAATATAVAAMLSGQSPSGSSCTSGTPNLSFASHKAKEGVGDREVALRQAFYLSLRRRVECGLSRSSWTAPTVLGDLTRSSPWDGAPSEGGGPSFAGPTPPGSATRSGASVPLGDGGTPAERSRRRLCRSTLPRLLPVVEGTATSGGGIGTAGVLSPPPGTLTQRQRALRESNTPKGCAPLLDYASSPQQQQQQQRHSDPADDTAVDGSPTASTAAAVERLWASSFWALLNGADAAVDMELLYGLLSATRKLTLPSANTASGHHHHHHHHHHGKYSRPPSGHSSANANGSLQKLSPLEDVTAASGAQRVDGSGHGASAYALSPATANFILAAIGNGTAEPVHWQTWFAMLGVLSTLTEGFFFDEIRAEEEEVKPDAGRARGTAADAVDNNSSGDLPAAQTAPPLPLAYDRSSTADGPGDAGGSPKSGGSLPPLREPSPEALSLLRRVCCPSLRNYKMGFDNVVAAAPALAARAAGPQQQQQQQQQPAPHGAARAGGAAVLVAGSEDGSYGSQPHRPEHSRHLTDPHGSHADALVGALSESFFSASALHNTSATAALATSVSSTDGFAFPVETSVLSQGSESAIRPVDVVLHALVTALEVQLEVVAARLTEDPVGAGNSNLLLSKAADPTNSESIVTPSPLRQRQQQQSYFSLRLSPTVSVAPNLSFASMPSGSIAAVAGDIQVTALLRRSASSVAAQRSHGAAAESNAKADGDSTAAAVADSGSAGAAANDTGWPESLSLPAIMRAEMEMLLESVSSSLDSVASMAEQLKSEASLLLFRVVSTLLDWLIPAVYLVSPRVWLFYRVWVCDLYALLHRHDLMARFTSILNQDGNESTEGLPIDNDNNRKETNGTDEASQTEEFLSRSAQTHTEPPSSLAEEAAGEEGRGPGHPTTAAQLRVRRQKGRFTPRVCLSHHQSRRGCRGSPLPKASSPATDALRPEPPTTALVDSRQAEEEQQQQQQRGVEFHSDSRSADTEEEERCGGSTTSCDGGKKRAGASADPDCTMEFKDRSQCESETEDGEEADGAGEGRRRRTYASASVPSREPADPYALVVPGCNLHLVDVVRRHARLGKKQASQASPTERSEDASDASSSNLGAGEASSVAVTEESGHAVQQAVVITRGTLTSPEGPGVHYRCIAAHTPPQLQFQEHMQRELLLQRQSSYHLQRPALRLLPEVTAAVRAAQALLDEGTYIPRPRRFMVSRLVAAAVRGMDPGAVRSLLAPFTGADARDSRSRGNRRTPDADCPIPAALSNSSDGEAEREVKGADDVSSGGGAAAVMRASTMPPMASVPSCLAQTPVGTGPNRSHGRRGAATPEPRLAGNAGGHKYSRDGGGRAAVDDKQRSGSGVRSPLGGILRAAPSVMENPKAPGGLMTAQQSTASAGHVEGPALVHHHRFRYPVVECVGDVGQLYVSTLHDAEGLLSPHDPLRAALVQSVVEFHLNQLQDPQRAIAILDDYLIDVGEESIQRPILQPAAVLGDTGAMAAAATDTAKGGRGGGGGGEPGKRHAATSAFSVTSVRNSQQKQLPPADHVTVGSGAAGGASAAWPQVPMVIPSWRTEEEEVQFLRVLRSLKGLQEMLHAQYGS